MAGEGGIRGNIEVAPLNRGWTTTHAHPEDAWVKELDRHGPNTACYAPPVPQLCLCVWVSITEDSEEPIKVCATVQHPWCKILCAHPTGPSKGPGPHHRVRRY